MNKKEYCKRYLVFFIGLFINSFGISFITKSALGTSPISSVPYTLSLGFTPTLGMFTLYMSIILVLIQIILMRKNFPKQYFLQIPISFVFSYFIDVTMNLLTILTPQTYLIKLCCLLIGCAILGFGVFLEIVADVAMLPGECFVNAVSKTFQTDFGKTKVAFDSSMTIIAIIISFVLFHRLEGVREGTVIAAVLVGMIARTLNRKIGPEIDRYLAQQKDTILLPDSHHTCTDSPLVITISREYGSGGRKIAKQLANDLGLTFYDRQIIAQAAHNLGMSEFEVEAKEQKLNSGFLYDLIAQVYEFSDQKAKPDKLFESEKQIIINAARKGNCVIVGRCANVICQEFSNAYHIFLYANDDYKTKQIMHREQLDYANAYKHMTEINRKRFNHYKYYTGQIWGLAQNYNLCVDTSKADADQTLAIMKSYVSC